MRTVLLGDCDQRNIFHIVDPDEANEAAFEATVARGLSCIYGNYQCIIFGGSFRYDDRVYKPDLALIARDFSHWFVIEVEIITHSLERHVLPQARAFRYGDLQQDCTNILARELGISRGRAATLTEHIPRAVAVIANRRDVGWQSALRGLGVQFLTVSSFSSSAGIEAVEIDGSLEVQAESLGFGMYFATDRSLRFALETSLPEGRIQIHDAINGPALWVVQRTENSVWVTKEMGQANIANETYVQLIRTVDGRISMRRSFPLG